MKIYRLILILGLTLECCNNDRYVKEMPKDFSFKLIDTIDSFDSKTGIFMRHYQSKDSSFYVKLSEKDLACIYNSFVENDFLSFPNVFDCPKPSVSSSSDPMFSTTIEISYSGIIKNVESSYACDKNSKLKGYKRFLKFYSVIWKILKSKPQVKNMRDGDWIFM